MDKCPFFPIEKLNDAQRSEVESLSVRLIKEDATVFPDIDIFFGKLYGLNRSDVEVITDTLEVREPNDELGERASRQPTVPERSTYCRRVESHIRPLFKALGKQPEVTVWKPSEKMDSPFVVLTLTAKGDPIPEPSELFRKSVLPLANETGATRIIKELDGGLMIAVLRQYRYWTPSRARMLGAEIIRNHMGVFED